MRPFWDNPPSSYRTEKHLYSNCCLLSTCYTLLKQKDAGGFIQITFKQNSFLLTDFYNRFLFFYFILLFLFCYPGSLHSHIYYYIFLRFGFFFCFPCFMTFSFNSFFHSVMFFSSVLYAWCLMLCLHFRKINTNNTQCKRTDVKGEEFAAKCIMIVGGFCLEDWLVDLISNNNNHNNMCCTRYYTNNNNNEQKKIHTT